MRIRPPLTLPQVLGTVICCFGFYLLVSGIIGCGMAAANPNKWDRHHHEARHAKEDAILTSTDVDLSGRIDTIGTLRIDGCLYSYYRGRDSIALHHRTDCPCRKKQAEVPETIIRQRAKPADQASPTPIIIDGVKGDPLRNLRSEELERIHNDSSYVP